MYEEQKDNMIRCPNCNAKMAVDEKTLWTIDCDCGQEVTIDNAIWLNPKDKDSYKNTKQCFKNEYE